MTFSRTAVETASCEVRKLLRTGRVPTTFTSVVPVVDGVTAYSVFAGLSVWDELFTDSPPPPPFHPSLIDCMWSLWTLIPTIYSFCSVSVSDLFIFTFSLFLGQPCLSCWVCRENRSIFYAVEKQGLGGVGGGGGHQLNDSLLH